MRPLIAGDQKARAIANIFTGCAIVLFAILIYQWSGLMAGLQRVMRVMLPFTVAIIVAFVLEPPLGALERLFHKLLDRGFKGGHAPRTLCRTLAAVIVYVLFIGIVLGFLAVVLPQLVTSLKQLVISFTGYINRNRGAAEEFLRSFNWTTDPTTGNLLEQGLKLWDEFASSILTNTGSLVVGIVNISALVSNLLLDTFVGLILSIYMLFGKEHFAAQCKKLGCSIMPGERVEQMTFWFRKTHAIFSGFIAGKLLSSLILGLVCYIVMLIFRMDYAMLISVIVGVTNIVPVFGPFIGGAIGVLILLVVNPLHPMTAVWFALIQLVLQQLEGNIIGPKVLGDTVGISSFWVIFSIVVGGGLFGLSGALLGIPVFALIYAFVGMLVEARLKRLDMPPETSAYYGTGPLPGKDGQER